jgi:predicted Zn finger-like uncharacterized protein
MNFDCENCEASFEIIVTDHLLSNGEPDIVYCPNCGKATLNNA